MEICETRNVSRGGLLVACKEHHNAGFPLWVTFPFDAAAAEQQPEVPARVLRSRRAPDNGGGHEEIALHFENMPIVAAAFSEKSSMKAMEKPAALDKPADKEAAGPQQVDPQKNGHLQQAAFPIRVRPKNIPWYEEAMTVEVSADELRFVSHRECAPGDTLLVTFVGKESRPWPGTGEAAAKIVKMETIPKVAALLVTIRRI
jgi:hypothetical protein